jgi:hypothetical protein
MHTYAQSGELMVSAPVEDVDSVTGTHLRHLRGASSILAEEGILREFAAATGQPATMDGLRYKLEHEFARRKSPHLFCIVEGQNAKAALTVESLRATVLLFEYRLAGFDTGFFATGDSTGVGTVIAPAEMRAEAASRASCAALRHGRMVLVCFRGETAELPEFRFPPQQSGLWAAQVREVRDRLLLCPSYEATLEKLGKRTRNHLRYYRRRLTEETGCAFVADAASLVSLAQLALLNASSLEPIPQRSMDLQFRAASPVAGGYVHGLRAANGQWLCLAGGWRQGTTSILEWQVNSADFRKLSLSTAFRSFLIENEVALGTKELCFHGGTSHSISHGFEQDYAVDLLLRRPGPLASMFVEMMPYFAEKDAAIANRGNFLIDALRHRNPDWTPIGEG